MRFSVTVHRDEDGLWIVECPAIPGCVSQGKTKGEALDNIKEAIALCLEVRAEKGLPLTIETQQVEGHGVMSALPALRGKEVVQIFESFGWGVERQRGATSS